MKKIELEICDLGMNGEGVAKSEGKVFFVPFALAGEKVEANVLKENAKFSVCEALNILEESKKRVKPICPNFQTCGGCNLQHLSYKKQCEFKAIKVKNTFKKICNKNVEIKDFFESLNSFNYRNKMVFAIKNGKIGMLKTGSHEIVEIENCHLASNGINKILKLTKNFLPKFESNNLRFLVVREIDNKFLITLVVRKNDLHNLNDFAKLLEGSNFGLFVCENTSEKEILAGKIKHIAGLEQIETIIFEQKIILSPFSFFQVNSEVLKLLYNKVLEQVKNSGTIIDAYSGAGLLSALLSKNAKNVFAVEVCLDACKNAKELLIENNIKNVQIICNKCENVLPKLLLENKSATVVLDPPQSGCENSILHAINNSSATKIIYVSCNPISLCKNFNILKEKFEIEEISLFDMFPETSSVETLCVLKRK